jgi:hypothetical protein
VRDIRSRLHGPTRHAAPAEPGVNGGRNLDS